jgi:hypothetical protein
MQPDSKAIPTDAGVPARYATTADSNERLSDESSAHFGGAAFQPLEPHRETSSTTSPSPDNDTYAPAGKSIAPVGPEFTATPAPRSANPPTAAQDVRPQLVGSRTFALEYELEQVGRWGISKVELWGTRDGGRSWGCYARDDDNRSPLAVRVDEEGLYGFRIVVESADTPAVPPAPGAAPDLWVAVDLQRPIAELTALDRGVGNMADHLILRWRADDNNLEPRPISLFYSSRPAGPWSAVATSLVNTGEYAWRVERHVPTRFYLRLEARDAAGNLAAFQTRDPIEFDLPDAGGRLRSAEPLDPTAVSNHGAYR